ncbi:hypothetical protein EV702DRAFT_1133567, partial [Suillus placidus]
MCKTDNPSGFPETEVKDEKISMILSLIREYLWSLRRKGGARASNYMVYPTDVAYLRRRFNQLRHSAQVLVKDILRQMCP